MKQVRAVTVLQLLLHAFSARIFGSLGQRHMLCKPTIFSNQQLQNAGLLRDACILIEEASVRSFRTKLESSLLPSLSPSPSPSGGFPKLGGHQNKDCNLLGPTYLRKLPSINLSVFLSCLSACLSLRLPACPWMPATGFPVLAHASFPGADNALMLAARCSYVLM